MNFKDYVNAISWFLKIGKGDTEHIRDELQDLLHHVGESLRTFSQLLEAMYDLPLSEFGIGFSKTPSELVDLSPPSNKEQLLGLKEKLKEIDEKLSGFEKGSVERESLEIMLKEVTRHIATQHKTGNRTECRANHTHYNTNDRTKQKPTTDTKDTSGEHKYSTYDIHSDIRDIEPRTSLLHEGNKPLHIIKIRKEPIAIRDDNKCKYESDYK